MSNAQNVNSDPLKILKLRFAKGEITREEYEEMRKMLES
ncbi:MAG: SHOCT domain-containing protein [Nitrososphaeraceae archaeon]